MVPGLQHHPHDTYTPGVITQVYRRGERLRLLLDSVVKIETGIVIQSMIHVDGVEVLLGLFGPGQVLIPHPEDHCYLQLAAHTDVLVCIQSWQRALHSPDLPAQLRARLWQQEAWAAMQARPFLEDRLLGILSLLAEQFGITHPAGVVVDVRLTHAQLACAIGANRTSVTRLLGELRKRARVITIGTGHDERFCLCQLTPSFPSHHVRFTTPTLSD